MEYIEFILLGILQGLTEFLPISSSGHILMGRKFFSISGNGLLIEIVLHLGTLFSILVFWYKDIIDEFDMKFGEEVAPAVARVQKFLEKLLELNLIVLK